MLGSFISFVQLFVFFTESIMSSTVSVSEESYKLFNDAVHGTIYLHPLCVKVIDTPQFQRLR